MFQLWDDPDFILGGPDMDVETDLTYWGGKTKNHMGSHSGSERQVHTVP